MPRFPYPFLRVSVRLAAAVAFVALWLAVIPLALEVYAYLRFRYIEDTNTFIQATQGMGALEQPPPEHRAAPLALAPVEAEVLEQFAERGQRQRRRHLHDPADAAVLPYVDERSDFIDPAKRAAAWRAYPELEAEQQRLFAAARRCQVVVGKPDGTFVEERVLPKMLAVTSSIAYGLQTGDYGGDVHGRIARLARKLVDTALSQPPLAQDILLEPHPFAGEIAFTVGALRVSLKEGGGQAIYVFVEEHPDQLYAPSVFPGLNSNRYRIPWYRLAPNVSEPGLRSNAFGMRDDPVALPRPEGMARILCIGGSTTMEGPANDHTYPNLLEKMLESSAIEPAPDVINAGVDGLEMDRQVARLHDFLAVEPTALLIYAGINDTFAIAGAQHGPQDPRDGWQRSARRSRFFRLHLSQWLTLSPDATRALTQAYYFDTLDALVRLSRAAGVPVIASTIALPDPDAISTAELHYYDYTLRAFHHMHYLSFTDFAARIDALNEALAAFCAERDIPLIPLGQMMPPGIGAFRDHCHLFPDGIAAKAEAMAPFIERLLLDEQAAR